MKHAYKENKFKTKYLLLFLSAALLLVFILNSTVNKQESVEVMSKYGSTGDEVKNIQTKLKSLELYSKEIDGIYGKNTEYAVIEFQKKNNLKADGIAGENTLKALGISNISPKGLESFSESDINLLANVISAESRAEPYTGQVAIGAVILNRIEHPSFPNTLADVIYQPGAFTCISDGQINAAVSDTSKKAAKAAINGWDPSNGAVYYYNPSTATNTWIRSRPVIVTIGKHIFCE